MTRPPLRLAASAAVLAPVSLVLSHELSLLAEYGRVSAAVLRLTGHDARWESAVQAVVGISAVLAGLGSARLIALWRTARRMERATGVQPHADWRGLVRTVLAVWLWLAPITTGWFLIQENLERLSIGQGVAGLGPLLDSGLAGPLLVIPVISLIVALIGGLFRWGVAALRARIAVATAAHLHRASAAPLRPGRTDPHQPTALARTIGLRAPPAFASA